MTEKRYRGNKYVDCYCDKHANIAVGTEVFKYVNIFTWFFSTVLALWALSSGVSVWYKLMMICILGVGIAPPPLNYRDTKAKMLKAGHSEKCSRKIARMYMFRASLWSERFKIMEDKDDGKRLWH